MILYSFLIVIYLCDFISSAKISCRDENGDEVDWFINYKLPKLEKRNDLIGEGLAYAYLVSTAKSSKWTLSKKNISLPTSMLGHTLNEFYNDPQSFTHLMYNDDNPNTDSSSVGHTKGVVVFDDDSGFWMIHSIPRFPSLNKYIYPSNGVENGQSVLCISFATSSLNEIGKQLIFNSPSIYKSHLTIDDLDEDVKTLFTSKPISIRKEPFTRITKLKSRNGQGFTIFSKDNQFNNDLYGALISPELKTSLLVETWRRGSGTPLIPSCRTEYKIMDILSIDLAVKGQKNADIKFKFTEDHSKWAISIDSKKKWICIGDINRMESQYKRGGGAACFSSAIIWKAFESSISGLDTCNI